MVTLYISYSGGGGGLVTKSCLTPANPMDFSPPGSSVRGISQARILEWVAISLSVKQLYFNKNK